MNDLSAILEKGKIMQNHKWADILIAIAQGKTVQFYDSCRFLWIDVQDTELCNPLAYHALTWRIKPEPKPYYFLYIGYHDNATMFHSGSAPHHVAGYKNKAIITINGDTHRVEEIKPIL